MRIELAEKMKEVLSVIDKKMKTNPYGFDLFQYDEFINLINKGDNNSLKKLSEHILSMYGGMGSFSDYVLEDGDNVEFSEYRTKLYMLASELNKTTN